MPILADCYGYDQYNCQALISHINISKMRSPVLVRDTLGSNRHFFHYFLCLMSAPAHYVHLHLLIKLLFLVFPEVSWFCSTLDHDIDKTNTSYKANQELVDII